VGGNINIIDDDFFEGPVSANGITYDFLVPVQSTNPPPTASFDDLGSSGDGDNSTEEDNDTTWYIIVGIVILVLAAAVWKLHERRDRDLKYSTDSEV